MKEERYTVRRDWYRMHMLGCVLLTAVTGLACSAETFALTKSAITIEIVVEDSLLDYEPSKEFKSFLSLVTCLNASSQWGFLNWCCGTSGCNQGGNELIWTVKLESEDEPGSRTSWYVNHFINSTRIVPDRFAQDELYTSPSEKPVTSDLEGKLVETISRQIMNQFKLGAFRDKATDLLVNKAPVAHELMTFKDSADRTVLTLPFKYCDLSLKKDDESTEPDDFLKFIVNFDFNNLDPNLIVLTQNGEVVSDRPEDKDLLGFIKGKITTSTISSLNVDQKVPVTDISNTIYSEHLNKVKSVYINSYTHDPASVCSMSEEFLVTDDPGNSPPQGAQP